MSDDRWDLWKLTAVGLAGLMAAALVIGLVMANWAVPVAVVMLPASIPEALQAPRSVLAREPVGDAPGAPTEEISGVCEQGY